MAHYIQVYNCLEQEYEEYNDAWEIQNSSLTEDAYNALCESINFDEDKPLIEFETNLSFSSFRAYLLQQELLWLENTNPDLAADPDNLNFFDDAVMETLWSATMDISIGDSLFHIDNSGVMWVVTNGDCLLLNAVHMNPTSILTNPNVLKHRLFADGTTCDPWEAERNFDVYDGGSKRIKWKINWRRFTLIETRTASSMKAFKKKNNGHWKKWRTNMRVQEAADLYDVVPDTTTNQAYCVWQVQICIQKPGECNDQNPGWKRRRRLATKVNWWGDNYQFTDEAVVGVFKVKEPANTWTHFLDY
ncbi:MAG: hypothetical protein SH856_06160 [Flavobacteriales bacterium]|nr:hypothetical protein [Flavobacteriales bacterium]